ncbi:T6SS immunity protein Tli3 family protein [Burkholderia ubonensis]|uniref:T6SS immunity protein Tli3 family protein n=1 Tax=Burkholderia ubonensis TaxID=101571 RepID=UPI000F58C130|nr:hypothetical protein [Burkholderia ubonensis]
MIRYFSLAVSALSLVLLTACSLLIPPGIPSGMTNPAARGTPTSAYPERLVYRIDDHRYITIQGNRSCDGVIWYYDTRLGIRTAVAATGLTLGGGEFGGYYAINSEYVVIPAIVFSQMRGSFIYIYYSHDGGRTFKSFLWEMYVSGKYSSIENVVVLDGKSLYLTRRDRRPPNDVYTARLYDVSQDVAVDEFRDVLPPNGRLIEYQQVPFALKSPSGLTTWTCPAAINGQ